MSELVRCAAVPMTRGSLPAAKLALKVDPNLVGNTAQVQT